MRTRYRSSVIVAAIAALAFSFLPTTSSAQALEWDQKKVAELGQELARTMSAARQAALLEPTLREPQPGSRRAAEQFLRTMRSLETRCRNLSIQLDKGADREATLNLARNIGVMLRDAQVEGRRLMISEVFWSKITPLVDVINRMSPYYSDESPLLPTPLNPPNASAPSDQAAPSAPQEDANK